MEEFLAQKKEDVVILKINKKINVIVGKKKISEKVHKIFDQKIINFLDYISQEIFKNKKNFEFKDLVIFMRFGLEKKYFKNFTTI